MSDWSEIEFIIEARVSCNIKDEIFIRLTRYIKMKKVLFDSRSEKCGKLQKIKR